MAALISFPAKKAPNEASSQKSSLPSISKLPLLFTKRNCHTLNYCWISSRCFIRNSFGVHSYFSRNTLKKVTLFEKPESNTISSIVFWSWAINLSQYANGTPLSNPSDYPLRFLPSSDKDFGDWSPTGRQYNAELNLCSLYYHW